MAPSAELSERPGALVQLRVPGGSRAELAAPVTRSEVVRSMLPGSARPRSRRQVMGAFHGEPRLARIRADHAGNVMATVQFLARSACWADGDPDPRATCRPTRQVVCDELGYSISTWKAVRRRLEGWGWVRTVRPGRSEEARLKSEQPELHYEGNDAAVYVLAIPPMPRRPRPRRSRPAPPLATAPPVTRPPTYSADAQGVNPVRPVDDSQGQQQKGTALRADSSPKPGCWLALQGRDVPKNLSDKAALREWRPFERRGWSMAEWAQAIDERPDGRRHPRRPSEVRYPWRWLQWRLSFWLGPDKKPIPPPRMQAAERRLAERREREQHLADQEARARTGITARTQAAGADPAPHAARIREQMGWTPEAPAGHGPEDGTVAAAGGRPGTGPALQPPGPGNGRSGPQGARPPAGSAAGR